MCKTKKILSLFLCLVSFEISQAQTPNWQWTNSGVTTIANSVEHGYSIAADISGNTYITGVYSTPSITFGAFTLFNTGGVEIFIVKYNNVGSVIWAKSVGGTQDDFGFGITTDASGNIYVTGRFDSPLITFGTYSLTGAPTTFFTAKYDSAGNALWAKKGGGWAYGNSITTDAGGNAYVTGSFLSPTLTFGSYVLTNVNNTNTTFDIFIVKYDGAGNELWAKSAGGNNSDYGNSITTVVGSNAYVTGYFESPSIAVGTYTLTNGGFSGSKDTYVVKYDGSGNVLWAKSAGTIWDDWGSSISSDASGNIYTTGWFAGASSNLAITFGAYTLTAPKYVVDTYIVKYDGFGNVLWAKSMAIDTLSSVYGKCITVDAAGNAYVIGNFCYGPSITLGTYTLTNTNSNYSDIFIVKYNSSGNVIWAKSAGGIYNDQGRGIAVNATEDIYITGYFSSPSITFTPYTLTNPDNTGSFDDVFVAKTGTVTSISQYSNLTSQISLYPNPTSGKFWVSNSSRQITDSDSEIRSIEIYNVTGKKIYQSTPYNNSAIDISIEPIGIYFVHVKTQKGIFTKKISIYK